MIENCFRCPALAGSRSQIVQPTPCPAGGLLCCGEAPGRTEDALGYDFAGRAGQTLDLLLAEHGFFRGDDFGVANACACWPQDNRKPTRQEITNCRPWLMDAIAHMRPSVVLLVGGSAVTSIIGDQRPLFDLINSAETQTITSHGHACQAIAMPHVSPLAWNRFAPNGERWSKIGRRQVARAVALTRMHHQPSQTFRLR